MGASAQGNSKRRGAWRGRAALFTVAATWLAIVETASAQQARGALWIAGAHAPATADTRAAVAVLRGASGSGFMDPMLTRRRFEQRGSAPPMLASHSDLDALARDAQQALYHVASGLPNHARRDVERALSRADRVLESLNRESLAAQHLLDACLYLVRAHLQSRQRDRARGQALECKRLVPDIEPDGTMHPPDVIGMLAEAAASLKLRTPGSLRIESEPAGCAVYVNGRRLGNTPLELPQLSPGEYRLQAECTEGELGRVHRVEVRDDRTLARIDTRFDGVVQTQVDLSLRYAEWQGLRSHALRDAVEVGRVVGAAEVFVVLPATAEAGAGTFQVHRVGVADAKLLGAVRLRSVAGRPTPQDAAQVIALLRGERFVDIGEGDAPLPVPETTGSRAAEEGAVPLPTPGELAAQGAQPPPAPTETKPAPSEWVAAPAAHAPVIAGASPEPSRWRPAPWALVLGATGLAATVASFVLYGHLLALESDYQATQGQGAAGKSALEATQDFQFVPLAVALTGAGLTGAALPWVLKPQPRLPVWSIALGVAGLGAAAAGTGLLIAGARCDDFDAMGRCTHTPTTTRLGAMLLAWGAPLVGVPLVHILRGPGARSDTRELSIGLPPGGLGLSVRGRL